MEKNAFCHQFEESPEIGEAVGFGTEGFGCFVVISTPHDSRHISAVDGSIVGGFFRL